jgi:hypothetical protein
VKATGQTSGRSKPKKMSIDMSGPVQHTSNAEVSDMLVDAQLYPIILKIPGAAEHFHAIKKQVLMVEGLVRYDEFTRIPMESRFEINAIASLIVDQNGPTKQAVVNRFEDLSVTPKDVEPENKRAKHQNQAIPKCKLRERYGRWSGMNEDMCKTYDFFRQNPAEFELLTSLKLREAIARTSELAIDFTEGLSSREASQVLFRLEWPTPKKSRPNWVEDLITEGFPPMFVAMIHACLVEELDPIEVVERWYDYFMHDKTSCLRAGSYKLPKHWWFNLALDLKLILLKRENQIDRESRFDFVQKAWVETGHNGESLKDILIEDKPKIHKKPQNVRQKPKKVPKPNVKKPKPKGGGRKRCLKTIR